MVLARIDPASWEPEEPVLDLPASLPLYWERIAEGRTTLWQPAVHHGEHGEPYLIRARLEDRRSGRGSLTNRRP